MAFRDLLARAFVSAGEYLIASAERRSVSEPDTFDVPDAEPYDDTATYEDTTTFVGTIGTTYTISDDDKWTYTSADAATVTYPVAVGNSWTTTPEP